jgi:NAD(P)-dependent dehydrogenase (short-subunit alcohol dehydrogenase family)
MSNELQVLANATNPLRGLRVAITGGTAGLGLALVRALHAQGAQVAFIARTASRVKAIAKELPGTHGIVGDVAVKEDIHPLALQILGRLGGVDALINNASALGASPLRPLADTQCEDFEHVLTTNVLGPFRLTKALLGGLAASARSGRGAVVLNVSSDAAVNAYPRWGAYGTSKAALAHMTRIWNEELGAAGIRSLALDPGDMDTTLHAIAVPDADASQLKQPDDAARELIATLIDLLPAGDVTRKAS